jgi:hypothetical protein
MKTKSLGLAAIALGCSIGAAAAQSEGPVTLDAQTLSKLVPTRGANGPMASGAAAGVNGGGATLSGPGNTPTGFNYFHVTNCAWYTDGTNQFLFIFPQEGGYWYTYNNIYTQTTWTPACQTGNWTAVYVINSSSGAFNEVYTYDFK